MEFAIWIVAAQARSYLQLVRVNSFWIAGLRVFLSVFTESPTGLALKKLRKDAWFPGVARGASCFTTVCRPKPLSIAKGALRSNSEDPRNPTNTNPLSTPQTRISDLKGTRITIGTSGY